MRTFVRCLCVAVCVFLFQEVATNQVGRSLAANWPEGDFEEMDEHEGGYHAFREWRRAHKAGEVTHAFSGSRCDISHSAIPSSHKDFWNTFPCSGQKEMLCCPLACLTLSLQFFFFDLMLEALRKWKFICRQERRLTTSKPDPYPRLRLNFYEGKH
ncbi:hypothetical protein CYMTET_2895 [Cymbomonas tetramitiformis]|uniref:Uncharacterized protein n=1 Tax=Cymbomonas tetramitiformis TaxID=36881 RepID=A0AAE0LLX1_9CHLO|nr:hypothetical protein CYMTET_2895 [Cymbomonas tetramitiformis]